MVAPNTPRASGSTGAEEEARNQVAELDQQVDDDVLDEERRRMFRHPGFSRMRVQWYGPDQQIIDEVRRAVNEAIFTSFQDAYVLMARLYSIVRIRSLDAEGNPRTDNDGLPIWETDGDGGPIEDWTRLTRRQREDFLGSITAGLFRWEQRSAELWGDSMMAKAQFEERFAISYDQATKATEGQRTAHGNIQAAEERYFAIYLTLVSKRAEAIVRAMDRLQIRIKDLLTA